MSTEYHDQDLRSLNAQNWQLKAEIERLTAELQTCRNTAKINLKVAQDRGAEIEWLRAALSEPITMPDIRLCAGEGKLSAHDMLAAANGVLRMRVRRALGVQSGCNDKVDEKHETNQS